MNTIKTQLPFFGVIKVTGEDAASFLHNQLSNDIQNLPINSACFASYNTPKGRVLANMLVLKTTDSIFLILAQDLCENLSKRLRMYVLRSKVVLEVATKYALAAVYSPDDVLFEADTQLPTEQLNDDLWQIKLPYGGQYLFGLADQESFPLTNPPEIAMWQQHEIDSAIPWINAVSSDQFVAQMLNLHLTGGVHFKKGCYPGQEIIARAQYRGQVKRGLVNLTSTNPLAESDLIYNKENEEVGSIINVIKTEKGLYFALAVIKYSAEENALFANQSELTVNKLFFNSSKTTN